MSEEAGGDTLEAERLALERARLELERELRRGELEIRRREVELKAAEQARSRWTNPLVLAGATAVLGIFGNLLLGQYTSRQQLALEREKRQGELLVKAISTDDQAAARKNLAFLIDIGLLPDEGGRITEALKDPGRVPVLPSPTGSTARPVRELPEDDPRRGWAAAVGRLQREGRDICTGLLVSERFVLTASYCAVDMGGAPHGSMTLVMSDHRSSALTHRLQPQPAELIRADMSNIGSLDGGVDYALLRLEQPLDTPPAVPALAVSPPAEGQPLAMVSHVQGGPAQIADDPACRVTAVGSTRFGHACASGPGAAGGPIFDRSGRVIGLEFASRPGGGAIGVRVDQIVAASAALRALAAQ